ncbi:MAG: hypothetical protein Kow0042_01810 [Calditrichia bacterium]
MLSVKVVSVTLGVFLSFSFVLCVLFGLATPSSVHMSEFLQNILPGFRWLSLGSFILGLVESFLWGVYIGVVYTPLYNFFSKKLGQTP